MNKLKIMLLVAFVILQSGCMSPGKPKYVCVALSALLEYDARARELLKTYGTELPINNKQSSMIVIRTDTPGLGVYVPLISPSRTQKCYKSVSFGPEESNTTFPSPSLEQNTVDASWPMQSHGTYYYSIGNEIITH